MIEKFTFGEHEPGLTVMRYTMTMLKEFGAKVTVTTELAGHEKFVLHTVEAEMPRKEHPIAFTRGKEG